MVTMKDIGIAAGVSRQTVSQVLNGLREGGVHISPVTRERVMEKARHLGYHRNELARAVKRGRTDVIAFIGGGYTSFEMRTIAGINAGLKECGFTLKMFLLNAGHSLDDAIRQCREQMVAGVICMSQQLNALEQLHRSLVQSGIPVMQVDEGVQCDWCGLVRSDDVAGGRMAVEHLLSLGHRRIGLLAAEGDNRYAVMRSQGYHAAMAAAGIAPDPALKVTVPVITGWEDQQKRILSGYLIEQRPTAVFCVADPLAVKLLLTANLLGIKVPDDLSVVGYADLDFASFSIPPLTTVAQPFEEEGRNAAASLVNIYSQQKNPFTIEKLKLFQSWVTFRTDWSNG